MDYTMQMICGDVHFIATGKYFILENPKRGLKTIALIPDIKIDNKDTVRVGYTNFDIVNLNADRLQVVDKTTFLSKNNAPATIFNKNYIYKRTK